MNYSINRLCGDAARFGLTPSKLMSRMRSGSGAKIFCTSIPKSGTHLLERAICLHGAYHRPLYPTLIPFKDEERVLEQKLFGLKPNQFLVAHWGYSDSVLDRLHDNNILPLFMIRDPRAIIVSHVKYAETERNHWQYSHYQQFKTMEEKLMYTIKGSKEQGWWSLDRRLDMYLDWIDNAHVVRFEDLINPKSRSRTICELFAYMGDSLKELDVHRISSRLVSDASPTYRGGGSSNWKSAFTDKVNAEFQRVAGEHLARMGY